MNCPNDRYVNDEEICQAVAAMLARIGVKVNLTAETKGTYFPKILSRNTSLLPARLDAGQLRLAQPAVRADGHAGRRAARASSTSAAYSNAKVDELTTEDRDARPTSGKRNAMIARGVQDPPGRRRPHPAAPAGAGLGDEEERRPRAAGRQLHVPEVGHGQVNRAAAGSRLSAPPVDRATAMSALAAARRWRIRDDLAYSFRQLAGGDRRRRRRAGAGLLRGVRRRGSRRTTRSTWRR